jgi:hypothetical protein
MTLPERSNGGELQTTHNPSPNHWPTFLISRKFGTILLQTYIGGQPGSYIESVGSKLIWCYPALGSGTIRPLFFLLPSDKVKRWEFPYIKTG